MTETPQQSQRFGRCLNAGRCSYADENFHIPLAPDAQLLCPKCGMQIVVRPQAGKPLVPVEGKTRSPKGLIAFGSVLAAMIGVGIYFNLFEPPPEPEKGEEEEERTELVGAAVEVMEQGAGSAPRINVMLFTLGASPDTFDQLAPNMVLSFMSSRGCISNPEKQMSRGIVRFSCDKKDMRFFIDVAPTEAVDAFGLRIGRQVDLLLTSSPETGGKPTRSTVIGYNPVAIVVHPANPLRSLTLEQAAEVFRGDVGRFNEVGGISMRITSYAGDDKTNEVRAFRDIVLNGKPLGSSTRRYADSVGVSSAVAGDTSAIGIVNISDVSGTRTLAINDILPVMATISGNKYPLSRPVRIDIPVGSRIRFAGPFATFAIGGEGQRAVRMTRFMPLPEDVLRGGSTPDLLGTGT